MNPQDLKRLIAGFLAFSVITSALTLVSLNFIDKTNSQQETTRADGSTGLTIKGENPLSTVSKNAFVEKLSSDAQQASGSGAAKSAYLENTSSNLTQNLARIFAGQIISNNPGGPQLDQDGNPTVLNLPSEDYATELIRRALATTTIEIGNTVRDSDLKIEDKYGPENIVAYIDSVNKILGSVASSTNSLKANAGQDFSPELLSLSQLALGAAEQKLKIVPVPRPLLNLHKTLVEFFANQSSIFQIASDYQTDPIKSIVVLKNSGQIIDRDFKKFADEFQKVKPELVSYEYLNGKDQTLFESILGVKTAYAIFGIGDIVNDPQLIFTTIASWAKDFVSRAADWAYNTALQIAVNILINEFQNQVVNWIAGNGNPKFITDWSGFLNDVANKAIGEAIYKVVPQLCTGIGPLVRIALLPVPYADTNVRCTLNQVVNSVNTFFDRFQNGSWYAYFAAMQPNNNAYGNLFLVRDAGIIAAANAKDAANSQAIASKGFLAVKKCVDERTDDNGDKWCAQEVDTTPGAVVAESLSKSLDWQPNSIINAKTFEGLVGAIVNASINRIIKEGLGALTEAANPSRPSFANAAPPGVASPTADNINYAISSLEQTGVFQENQNIINTDTQWLVLATGRTPIGTVSSTIDLLNKLASSCSAFGSGNAVVLQRIRDINALASSTITELNKANNIAALKASAPKATSSQDIANIFGQLQTLDLNQITAAVTAAQDRLTALQYFTSLAQDSLISGDCGTGLPYPTTMPPPPDISG